MVGRRIIAVVVAAALALLGAVLVYTYASNADERALRDQQPRTVYVTTKIVPSGTTLKDAVNLQLIKRTTVAAKALPAGALQGVDGRNSTLLAVSDIGPGQYVLTSAFGTTKLGTKAIDVPAGKVAVSVALSDPARVGRFVTPGSDIMVFQTFKPKIPPTVGASKEEQDYAEKCNGLDFRQTEVLLPKVKVIGVGDTALSANGSANDDASDGSDRQASQSAGASFLVTLAVTPQESVDLVQAINSYTLYAGLLGADVPLQPGLKSSDQSTGCSR